MWSIQLPATCLFSNLALDDNGATNYNYYDGNHMSLSRMISNTWWRRQLKFSWTLFKHAICQSGWSYHYNVGHLSHIHDTGLYAACSEMELSQSAGLPYQDSRKIANMVWGSHFKGCVSTQGGSSSSRSICWGVRKCGSNYINNKIARQFWYCSTSLCCSMYTKKLWQATVASTVGKPYLPANGRSSG